MRVPRKASRVPDAVGTIYNVALGWVPIYMHSYRKFDSWYNTPYPVVQYEYACVPVHGIEYMYSNAPRRTPTTAVALLR